MWIEYASIFSTNIQIKQFATQKRVQQTVFEKQADSFKRAWFTLPDSFKIIWNPCHTVLNFFGFLFTPAAWWFHGWTEVLHIFVLLGIFLEHCQRHNGPLGWVLLTIVMSLGYITTSKRIKSTLCGRKSADCTKSEFDVTFLVTFETLFRRLKSCAMAKIETASENIWVAKCVQYTVYTSLWTTISSGGLFYYPSHISSGLEHFLTKAHFSQLWVSICHIMNRYDA